MNQQLLSKQLWTLQAVGTLEHVPEEVRGQRVPATVPGCVHTDLLAAELIPDPYRDENENELGWIGRTDWRFETQFEVTAEALEQERLELVCLGLDTVARLEVNGQRVAETKNMHRAYRFDVKPLLKTGENTLSVTFAAPVTYAERVRDDHGDLPNAYPDAPFNFIRKMACNFGWDWGPALTTAGIWQPIYLDAWSGARVAAVRPLVFLNDDLTKARVELHAGLDWASEGEAVQLEAQLAGVQASAEIVAGQTEAILQLELDNPDLWWPVGHGEQPLYDLILTLKQGDTPLDEVTKRIGVRKTELDTSVDSVGSAFTVKINHKPIFIKGANWIPDDCFPTRITEARYRERITQALDANMNMLRVWGGGLYEQEAFYDACDELGILVWQDFLFACAAYPEEEPFYGEVEAEARYQVTRLSPHPSLVLWDGNNENIWGYFSWGWQEQLQGRTWGKGYYLELLPNIVADLDPTRPYWPGSPYSGSFDIHPLADNHGNKHLWDAWNTLDYAIYRAYVPRFVSEFGHQAPATYATLAESLSERPLAPDSPGMLHHQKAIDGNKKLLDRLLEHFPEPRDFDAWHYATQLNQARAVEYGVTHWRSHAPTCMGTLYWQLNDCWPVTSWAAVDGYGRRKPFWYATKRFYADRLLAIQPRGAKLVLFACNDSDEVWTGEVTLQRIDFAGEVLAEERIEINVDERSTQRVLELPFTLSTSSDSQTELIVARAGKERALWFFERDKDLHYPEARVETRLERNGNLYHLTLSANSLIRDVAVFVDRLDLDATISDQLVTLLPGESFTFEIHSKKDLPKEKLVTASVFQCANLLGSPTESSPAVVSASGGER